MTKLGFFRKTKFSNKRLVVIFEENQRLRYSTTEKDWQDKKFTKKLKAQETNAKKEILLALKSGKIKTADDFYRASWFFHHSPNHRDNAMAVALAATSWLYGEPWGKNLFAVTLDRFLLAIKNPQHFVTQYEKKNGKWKISDFNKSVTDSSRKEFSVDPLNKTQKIVDELNTGK